MLPGDVDPWVFDLPHLTPTAGLLGLSDANSYVHTATHLPRLDIRRPVIRYIPPLQRRDGNLYMDKTYRRKFLLFLYGTFSCKPFHHFFHRLLLLGCKILLYFCIFNSIFVFVFSLFDVINYIAFVCVGILIGMEEYSNIEINIIFLSITPLLLYVCFGFDGFRYAKKK